MKRRMLLLATLLTMVLTASAKKVKLTIDGTLSPTQTTLYLIVNEDTAHAMRVPIVDAKFSVQVKVDADAFIRLHDYKGWPERSVFVLIPDSRHITINTRDGSIKGSEKSLRLREAIDMVGKAGPGNFHIDVFSDDKDAWARARQQERAIRAEMEKEQRQVFRQVILDNQDNLIPAWLVYCYPELAAGCLSEILRNNPKWAYHPILKKKE